MLLGHFFGAKTVCTPSVCKVEYTAPPTYHTVRRTHISNGSTHTSMHTRSLRQQESHTRSNSSIIVAPAKICTAMASIDQMRLRNAHSSTPATAVAWDSTDCSPLLFVAAVCWTLTHSLLWAVRCYLLAGTPLLQFSTTSVTLTLNNSITAAKSYLTRRAIMPIIQYVLLCTAVPYS